MHIFFPVVQTTVSGYY